jgi:hypothetical protein
MNLDSVLERPPPRRIPAGSPEQDSANPSSSSHVAAARNVTQHAGTPLDAGTQRTMGERFDCDFSNVRVHSDGQAADSARSLDALAYSFGSHVVFGQGQYSPATPGGQQLLAHELAHVVQQDDAGSHSGARQAADTSTLEHEADHAATSAMSGHTPAIGHRAAGPAVLRQAAPGSTAPEATATPAQQPRPAPKKPERQQWQKVGREKNLDAELDRKAGWLTLKMRVKFAKDNSLDPWPADDALFKRFQGDFCQKVQKRWSFRHFLVPKAPCLDEPARAVVRLQITPVTSGEHSVARVKYTSERPTSTAWGKSANLDINDIGQRSDIPQTPVEHEFGHMLGIHHINCSRNEDECYGVTREQKADIMGEGSFVSPHDYEVFAEVMSAITGCAYGVQQASFIPPTNAPAIGALVGALIGGGIGAGLGFAVGGPLGAFIGGAIGILGGAIAGYFAGKSVKTPPEIPA